LKKGSETIVKRNGTSRTTGTVLSRFDELIDQGEKIKDICKKLYFAGNKRTLDPEVFEAWRSSCLSLLKSTFGSSSPHFDNFVNRKFFDFYNSTQIYLGILKGAKEDLSKGYFFHKDLMLSVNIFDSLINRSRRQLEQDRVREAQVILRVVLAEVLVKICENKNVLYEADDSPEQLVDRLSRAEAIPRDIEEQLLDLRRRFADEALGREKVGEALEILLRFLDDYLGSQIIILN
jgi:hypothetical protein